MPDPIDELENFDPGAPMTPLPPSEVRRLGDRHRRRRTAGIALAAAAAVAVVATGSAVLAGGEPRALDPAAPNPTVTTSPSGPLVPDSPTTEPPFVDSDDIPEGFPLAAGWPDRHEPGEKGLIGPAPDLEVLDRFEVCGSPLPAPAPVDRLGASWADVEDYRYRLLLSFDDADAAIAYQAQFLDTYRACPRTEEDADGFVTVHDALRTQVGGESWAVVRTFEYLGAPAIGLEVVHVIRLGRALLIDTAATEGGGGPDPDADARGQITRQTDATTDVVSAMCTFTEAGCVE
ncbi:MAG: hypothetical protein Q8O61_17610 [Nocardioides sp.]|nr:hypothetical protein [Nocardioides sp.]